MELMYLSIENSAVASDSLMSRHRGLGRSGNTSKDDSPVIPVARDHEQFWPVSSTVSTIYKRSERTRCELFDDVAITA